MLVKIPQLTSSFTADIFVFVVVVPLWWLTLPSFLRPPAASVLWLEAVHAVELLLLVGEAQEAHGGLPFAAVLAGSGDGVAHAAVGQPAGVAAVVAVEFPCGKHVAHLGDFCIVVQARLHSLVIGQPLGLLQPIEGPWGVGGEHKGKR